MIDWTKSMQQTFEYYIVDPNSWKDTKRLDTVISSTIVRDSEVETLGSATLNVLELVGECYVRVYLVAIQNGVRERFPLGTFLVQTPTSTYDGKVRNSAMEGYTPLIELKEKKPPIGYTIPKGNRIMEQAYILCRDKKLIRAPIVKTHCDTTLTYDFVANVDDTWLSFLSDLIANGTHTTEKGATRTGFIFELDEMGRILFGPKQDVSELQPVWTYNDDNSSILGPDVTVNHDLYGIPNVVEVVYSNGNSYHEIIERNEDPGSPTSIQNRGREIIHRITEPNIVGISTDANISKRQLKEYARQVLSELSTISYTVSYSHGYCPVRLGDCVRLNYSRAGLNNVKAKVISQTINCKPGCMVTEKAIFTTKLWG